jgi:hypothetical protein
VIVVMNVIMQSGLKLLDAMGFGEIEEFRFERAEEAFDVLKSSWSMAASLG